MRAKFQTGWHQTLMGMVPPGRIELPTSALPRIGSTMTCAPIVSISTTCSDTGDGVRSSCRRERA